MKRGTILCASRHPNTIVIIRCALFCICLLLIMFPNLLMPSRAAANQTTFGAGAGEICRQARP